MSNDVCHINIEDDVDVTTEVKMKVVMDVGTEVEMEVKIL